VAQAAFHLEVPSNVNMTPQPIVATPLILDAGGKTFAQAGETVQYSVGADPTQIEWSVDGAGAINATGLYTAPITLIEDQSVSIHAKDKNDPTRTAQLPLLLLAHLQMTASTLSLHAGETAQMTVAPAVPVTWTVDGDGAISSDGLYTAPDSISGSHLITIDATDAYGREAQTPLLLLSPAPPSLAISAPIAMLKAGESVQLSVTPSEVVRWTVPDGDGTVSVSGLYVAPAVIPANRTVTVVASTLDGTARVAQIQLNLVQDAILYGDVQEDQKVNVGDAVRLLRAVVQLTALSSREALAGDLNGDGQQGVGDVILLLRFAVGLIPKFPVQP
jgi:hypothetical protein